MIEPLKKIIHSLSKREINYFIKFSRISKNSTSSNYIKLFNDILASGNINVNKEKGNSKKKNNINIAFEKGRLFEKLLLSISNFNFEKDNTWKILKKILFIKVLIEKGVTSKATKMIEEAKKVAYHFEEYDLLLYIISLEETLCFKHCFIECYSKLKELQEERKRIAEIIDFLNYLLMIKAELQQFQCEDKYYASNLDDFIKEYGHSPIIQEQDLKQDLKSVKVKSAIIYLRATCFYIQHDYPNSFLAVKEHYELFKKFPYFFSREEYIQLTSNLLYCCCLVNEEETFHKLMKEFVNLKNQTDEEHIFIMKLYYARTLDLYHRIGKFQEAAHLSLETENFLDTTKSISEPYHNRYIHVYIVRAYINNKNYSAALHSLNKYFRLTGVEHCITLFKLFEFIIHYKLENFDTLIYSINSWIKTIRNKRKQFPVEKVLIYFFRSIYNSVTFEQKKELLFNVTKQLKELEQNEFKTYLSYYFDFAGWFENELNEVINK